MDHMMLSSLTRDVQMLKQVKTPSIEKIACHHRPQLISYHSLSLSPSLYLSGQLTLPTGQSVVSAVKWTTLLLVIAPLGG